MSTTQTVATPATPDVVVPEIRDYAAEVTALLANGTPDNLYAEADAARATLGSGLIPWFALANDIHRDKGMTPGAFAEMVGRKVTDKNYLLRLRLAHVLYVTHADKGLGLSPLDAMKVANARTKGQVEEIVLAVNAGDDPLDAGSGEPVKPNTGEKNSRKGGGKREPKGLASEPKDYAAIMDVIMARVTEAPESALPGILAAAMAIVATLEDHGIVAADLAA